MAPVNKYRESTARLVTRLAMSWHKLNR